MRIGQHGINNQIYKESRRVSDQLRAIINFEEIHGRNSTFISRSAPHS
jgi:hypothetical protein